jgi:hypothetical protein
MATIVRNSSPSLANVGMEVTFRFNVTHDRCKGIPIADVSFVLKFLKNILFVRVTGGTLPRLTEYLYRHNCGEKRKT